MKTTRLAGLLVAPLALAAFALPGPASPVLPRPATASSGWAVVARYRTLRDTELPALLAWLRDRGPFTRPRPDLPLAPAARPAALAESPN